jgi:hypothetical protein
VLRVDHIEKLAAHNAANNDTLGSLLRKAYRHLSKTYHTPLHIAERDVPEYEALLVYFEDQFDELDAVELADRIALMYKKPSLEQINSGYVPSESGVSNIVGDEEWVAHMNIKLRRKEEDDRQADEIKKATQVVAEVDKAISQFNESMKATKED